MSPRKPATPLHDRLADLDGEVRQARRRLHELEVERTASARRLEAARAPLDAYYEAVGAGERQPDADEEARLVAALRDVSATVRLEVAGHPHTGSPALVAIDDRAERLVTGAQRAVRAAEDAVLTFQRVERTGLAAELTARAEAARAAQEAAVPALAAAVADDQKVRAGWRRLLTANGQTDTVPRSPLRGWDDELAAAGGRIPLAVPDELREDLVA
jgi:hypothetical protein